MPQSKTSKLLKPKRLGEVSTGILISQVSILSSLSSTSTSTPNIPGMLQSNPTQLNQPSHPLPTILPSINPRNQPPPHDPTILIPLLPILTPTPRIIPAHPMQQQNHHIKKIRPRQNIPDPTRRAKRKRLHQIRHVIHVSRDAPPSRCQEERGVRFPVGGCVAGGDVGCGFAPECDRAVVRAHPVSLVVGGAEDVVA